MLMLMVCVVTVALAASAATSTADCGGSASVSNLVVQPLIQAIEGGERHDEVDAVEGGPESVRLVPVLERVVREGRDSQGLHERSEVREGEDHAPEEQGSRPSRLKGRFYFAQ